VTSGGFGVGPLREIVRSCAAIPNVALTVVCGASEELRARVAADLAGTNAHVIGFERDMPARVADAHVVVGKAGGLTVSETLTAGRPMIIVGTVPGNEQQNENFVTAGRAGYACAPHEVGARLAAMRASSEITAMGSRARALVTHASATRVLALCNTLAPTSRAA
jgi:processive 1,2-diacylglycerol beta-glucosyltransferase